jgi:hypothetical protein
MAERVRTLEWLAGQIRGRPSGDKTESSAATTSSSGANTSSSGANTRSSGGKTRLVAVDGRGGAGKSTVARGLAAACGGAPIVRVDDFLYWRDIEGWWPRLEHEALRPLLAGRAARYRVRDWAGDPLGQGLNGWTEVPPADIVIVEGIGSSRRAISGDLALALWVETPREERLRRGIARDGEERRGLWLEYMALEDEFFRRDGAPERADYVINGQPGGRSGPDTDPATEVVLIEPG